MLAYIVTIVLYAVQFGVSFVLFGSAIAALNKQGRGPFTWPVLISFCLGCGLLLKLVRVTSLRHHKNNWGQGLVILEVLGTMFVNFADIFWVAAAFHLWQHRRRVLHANHPRHTRSTALFMWSMVFLMAALNLVGTIASLVEIRKLVKSLNRANTIVSLDPRNGLLIAGTAWVATVIIWVLSLLTAIIASQILYWQTRSSRDKVTRVLAWGVAPLFVIRLVWLISRAVFLNYGSRSYNVDGLGLFFNEMPTLIVLVLYLYLGLSNRNLDMWSLPKRNQPTNQYVQLNNQSDVLLAKA
ncbi:hypothetical protein NEOLI_004192 [Neolecta irregularis DAH-3]|uniref:Uncharacterized protein n=1 Tax=Neolecta irregularis (strain DAH-3) TaxID=1198029 RepID=A0A1U7LV35_NEOID|nr:hypothetical protein NEOLI_004192 [Neolecta irregularis DAH-3]|eukprot:OLL26504.1 hypothetical protein NEOLI_004192 [Neolecta irregularis DAH-3]